MSNQLTRKLKNAYFSTLTELLKISTNHLTFYMEDYEVDKLVDYIHRLGLKFNCELNSDEEKLNQSRIMYKIRLLGLIKYIKKIGSPKYLITNIEELEIPSSLFNGDFSEILKYRFSISTIEELLEIKEIDLKLFLGGKNKMKKFIEYMHELGYVFDFEQDEQYEDHLKVLSLKSYSKDKNSL